LDDYTFSLISEIRNYTEDQLEHLLKDEARLNGMVDNLPQIRQLITEKEMKLTQSKILAEHNLTVEPKLKDAVAKLTSTHSDILKNKESVDILKVQLDSISDSRSLDTVSALLQLAVQQADDQSEKMAENFYDGEIEIEDFTKRYVEKRSEMHLKKLKSDKLLEIMRQQQYKYNWLVFKYLFKIIT